MFLCLPLSSFVLFTLHFQIESKLQFITAKLEPGTKIHLIGHSFGAYIALKLFEKGKIFIFQNIAAYFIMY